MPAVSAIAVVLCLVLSLVAAACGGAVASSSPSPSASAAGVVVARVDGVPVFRHEVTETIAASRLTGSALTTRQATEAMIKRRLVEAEARRLGAVVPAAQVQARLDQVAQSVGGLQTLTRQLSQVGLTTAAYRRQLEGALLAERVADKRFSSIMASTGRARAYYRSHVAEFTTPPTVDLADIVVRTQRMAQAVERRLHAGGAFAAIARQYSADPESKDNGGRLGWVRVDSLPPDLARVLAGASVGQVARPVQAIGGWHVVKLFGRRAAHVYPFARVRDALVTELTRQARDAALARQLAAARARAQVVVLP